MCGRAPGRDENPRRGKRFLIGDYTRAEFRRLVESEKIKIGMVPVAATEQHLEHLEMATDCIEVEAVTRAPAVRLHPLIVVTPTVSVGVSEHHMKHPGSLTVRWEIFTEYVFDLVGSLVRGGVGKVLIVNGHGGNVRPLASVMGDFEKRLPEAKIRFLSYWDLYPERKPLEHLDSGTAPGHAGEFATSALLYIDPKRVHKELLAEGEAAGATIEKGKALMQIVINALTDYIRAFIDDKENPVSVKSWFKGRVIRGIEGHPFVGRGRALPGEEGTLESLPTDIYE